MPATTSQQYRLRKPDGSLSGPNEYSAISRLQGHFGGTIEKVAVEYDVFMTLAGRSASRKWCKSYRSLTAAKKFADTWAGYGRVVTVVDKATGRDVYSVHVARA